MESWAPLQFVIVVTSVAGSCKVLRFVIARRCSFEAGSIVEELAGMQMGKVEQNFRTKSDDKSFIR